MSEKLIGRVSHYFDNLGVAVLKLDKSLKVGAKIKFVGGEVEFEQTVDSMQVERKAVNKVKAGADVGLKVDGKVRPGYKVFLIK